jgi:hypothetical protein
MKENKFLEIGAQWAHGTEKNPGRKLRLNNMIWIL